MKQIASRVRLALVRFLDMAPTWLLVIATPLILWAISRYRIDRKTHTETLATLTGKIP